MINQKNGPISGTAAGSGINRRSLMVGASVVLSAPFVLRPKGARAADSIVIVDDGGTVQEAKREIFFKRFTEDTGIEVIEGHNPSSHIDRLAAQVRTGNIEWDVIYLNGQGAHGAHNFDLVDPIDYDAIDVSKNLHPEWVLPGALCWGFFAGGIAFNPAKHPEGTYPTSYPEFWDVENFPGRRGMLQRATYALEMALAADGVPSDQIYPIDYDRAFASLDRIKDHIQVWMVQNEQTINMIQTGETDFNFTFQNRVIAAQQGGVSIDFVRHRSVIQGPSYISIVKGTPKRDLAQQFLTYVLRPDLQAELANAIGIPPENADAYPFVNPAILEQLPVPGAPDSIALDSAWWGENLVEAEKRFTEWLVL